MLKHNVKALPIYVIEETFDLTHSLIKMYEHCRVVIKLILSSLCECNYVRLYLSYTHLFVSMHEIM